jgi:polysaccharide biosynthesis protein PslH
VQWQRFARVQTNLCRKAAIHLEWHKMRAFERHVVAQFDHVAAVSDKDAQVFRSLGASSVEIIPNGVDTKYYECEDSNGHRGDAVLAYCGSMDAFVNQDAVMNFAKNILSRIREKVPNARFMIVGRRPPASIRNLANDHITVSGTVDDVRPLLGKATVSVVPLRIAGGSRLKILESFAAGIPVVSTSIGAEGLGVKPGVQLLIADDESSFAADCIRLLEEPRLRQQLVRTARSYVRDEYDWRAIAPLVEAAWECTRRNFVNKGPQRSCALGVGQSATAPGSV